MVNIKDIMLGKSIWHETSNSSDMIVQVRLTDSILLAIPGVINIWKKERLDEDNKTYYEMHIDYTTSSRMLRSEVIFNPDENMNINFLKTKDMDLDSEMSRLKNELTTCWEVLSTLEMHKKVFKRRTINFN